MLSPSTHEALRQPVRVLYLIWFAFLSSHLIYVVVAFVVAQSPRPALEPDTARLFQIGAVVLALGSAVAAQIYDRFALSEEKLKQRLHTMGAPEEVFSARSGSSSMGMPEGFEGLSEREQKVVALLPYYQTSMIVRWAFLESITIYGLVGLFVGALDLQYFLPFPIVAFALLATTRPDVSGVLDTMARHVR